MRNRTAQSKNDAPARLPFFVTCAPGLEGIAAAELKTLGFMPVRVVPGGAEISGRLDHLYRANLWSRVASRVLLRLGEFRALAFGELRNKAAALPWQDYLRPGRPVRFNVTAHKSRLYHTGGIAERLAGAIAERVGVEPSWTVNKSLPETESGGDQALIVVRFEHDVCTISLDSSGEALHRRGYRLETAKAPLRETLAAGMLLACGWDPAAPLLDPFCGAGTIAIEAALLARRIPPGRSRRFAFMDWPGFDAALWDEMLQKGAQEALPNAPAPILAFDRDAGAIEAARANAERAGVAGDIQFAQRTISELEAPEAVAEGWVITNPPYGVRTGEAPKLRDLYARLGQVLRRRCSGWRLGMLVGSPALKHSTGLQFEDLLSLVNGGLRVRLVQARVPVE